MGNLKQIALVMLASIAVVALMVFGLSSASKGETGAAAVIGNEELTDGARIESQKGERKVTVVEFTDMQCPACKSVKPLTDQLKMMDGVRMVYRHFPLISIHKNAWKAARAVEAAREQEKAHEMMDKLFDTQAEWSELTAVDSKFEEYAKTIGLDGNKFKEAYLSDRSEKGVVTDNTLAAKLKLQGTPTFFVNGEQVASNFVMGKVEELLKNGN